MFQMEITKFMNKTFIKIISAGFFLIIIDSIYLYFVSNYFSNQIRIIQFAPMKINILATILCYLILAFSINYFIIIPRKSLFDAFLLGISIYGVYELTNKALFSKWSWFTVFIDTLWGGILFALTAYITLRLI